jgi:hypothetical protein
MIPRADSASEYCSVSIKAYATHKAKKFTSMYTDLHLEFAGKARLVFEKRRAVDV